MIKTRNIIHKAKPFYRIEYQVFSSILLNILMFEKNETIFEMAETCSSYYYEIFVIKSLCFFKAVSLSC